MTENYDIAQWLCKQPIWLQETASRLRKKRDYDNKDVLDILRIIKEEASAAPDCPKPTTITVKGDTLHLVSLKNPQGIEKLKPRKPLEFGLGNIAIVYGNNGSGKSGYVRILKKVCGKTNSPLKHDVFGEIPSKQACTIAYSANGKVDEIEWNAKEAGIPALEVIDIFDGEVGDSYLRQEREAIYLPHELILFADLVRFCDELNSILSDEKSKLVSKLPQLPETFRTTIVGSIYTNLMPNTSPSFASFDPKEEKTLDDLRERLSTSDAIAKAKKLREKKKQLESIITLMKCVSTITSEKFLNAFRELCDTAYQKRQNAKEGMKVLNETSLLDGVGNDCWKALWKAAREYSTTSAYKDMSFPNTNAQSLCVLCHQELSEDAKNRLEHFESFIQGQLEKEAVMSEEALLRTVQAIPNVVLESDIRTKFQAAGLCDALGDEIWSLFVVSNDLIVKLNANNPPDTKLFVSPDFAGLVEKLEAIADEIECKALQFEEDSKSFNREDAQAETLELEARQWITQQKDAVKAEIDRINDVQAYDRWMSRVRTHHITTEAGKASEKLITEAYVERFNKELQKLGASKITVELVNTRNEKGKGKYRIQLKSVAATNMNPADILSEGEKRIVALAAFLADVTGRTGSVPFVFDDPISSLDQEFEERTITRLVELGQERQVIVFTHRLSFLSILTDIVGTALTTVCINSELWGTGEPSDTPINMKITKNKNGQWLFKNYLVELIEKAKMAQQSEGAAAYSIISQAICSDFRKILERIVETKLLADVVQRHRRAVHTQNKIHRLALINKADCDLIDEMMAKYSAYEHSQSNELPGQLPMPNEMEADISRIAKWLDDFSKRVPS